MPTGIDTTTARNTALSEIQTPRETTDKASGEDFLAPLRPFDIPWRADSNTTADAPTPQLLDSFTQSNGMKVIQLYAEMQRERKEKEIEVIAIDGKPLERTVQTRTWFTPCLFLLFVFYAFTLATRKKMLNKEIRNIFSPTTSGEITFNTPIEELQEQMPLLILAAANIAWLAHFCVNTYFHITEMPGIAWLSSILAVGATLGFQLLLIQAICYVFFDGEIFHKLEKLKLLSFSFIGIALIPSVLLLAYAPTALTQAAIYLGIGAAALIFTLYLLRTLPFFFKGTLSIFYLILYLCTIEILPAIALILGLERIN